MSHESPRTKIGNEPALRQIKSTDGRRVLSIVGAAPGLFRFTEETEVLEPETATVPAYWYWTQTHRSGVYESVSAAESDAIRTLPWLNAKISK
jgi:hypothetical protein